MIQPPRLEFRNIPPMLREAIEPIAKERAAKLDRYFPDIIRCRVVVDMPHSRRHKGNLYRTKITLTIPGHQIAVNREHPQHHSHEDALVSINHAFDDAVRRLEEYARIEHRDVKDRDSLAHGMISKIDADGGYGFIHGVSGDDVYFHANSVIDGFENLREGTEVRYDQEEGEKGLQASTVKIVRKEHLHHRH